LRRPKGRWALCVGAMHWDVVARAARAVGPGDDAPGRVMRRPGGVALNVALALAKLRRPAAMLGVVGDDPAGARLISAVERRGVDCAAALRRGVTDRYVAIEAQDGALVAAVADCAALEGAGDDLLAPLRDGALGSAERPWSGPVVADGNLADPVLAALAAEPALVEAALAIVPASPAKAGRLSEAPWRGRAAIYLNRREAEAICRCAFPDANAAAAALIGAGWAVALVTDGPRRAAYADVHGLVSAEPPGVEAHSVTGAGDVLVAAHLVARADGQEQEAALAAALAAAAAHVAADDAGDATGDGP
jgi:pseudouridine kinase